MYQKVLKIANSPATLIAALNHYNYCNQQINHLTLHKALNLMLLVCIDEL